MELRDFLNEHYLQWPADKEISGDDIGDQVDYIVARAEDGRFQIYRQRDIWRAFLHHGADHLPLAHITPLPSATVVREDFLNTYQFEDDTAVFIIVGTEGNLRGVIERRALSLWQKHRRELWSKEIKIDYYERILNSMEDEIFITDEYGFIQYINPRGEYICHIKLEDWRGHHVYELVENHIVSKSVTLEVLNTKKPVTEIVKMSSGRYILSTARAIYDRNGKMVHILSTSKDIKEINELVERLGNVTEELDSRKREIAVLQEQIISSKQYVFESSWMKQAQNLVKKIAPTDISVLIEGESGTGKEVVADLICQLSPRHNQPFVKINCGLIPKDLLESELFGYEGGAFTGASRSGKIGKIETANGGTLFFDEIGEMDLALQVKLLEFLQDRVIVRVGGTKKIPIDVRIIAATNRDLKKMVEEGKFRGDLYYRLNVMPIALQPLKSRQEDIAPLANMFLKRFNRQYRCEKRFAEPVLRCFLEYEWPGNVRELMHTIERLIITAEADLIDTEQLQMLLSEDMTPRGSVICTNLIPLKEAKAELEAILVKSAYEKYGNSYKAAEILGINQSTVVRLLHKSGYHAKKH